MKKRVGELAFKSIDLKGEASRRLTMVGQAPTGGGAGGGDLSTWLHVVDATGLYCYEPVPGSSTTYRRRGGVPTAQELERVLYRACIELRGLSTEPPPPIPVEVPPSPAAEAASLTQEANDE